MDKNSDITENKPSISHKKNTMGVLGILGVIVGVIAWFILYRHQWGGIIFALIGIILSIIGLNSKLKNIAIFGLIISSTLLIVAGIMWIAFFYIFQSIK